MKSTMDTFFLAIIIGFVFTLFNNSKFNKKREAKHQIQKDYDRFTEIDSAVSFGYKCAWFAVKTNNKKRVSELLKIKNPTECNWKIGIDKAYENSIYITPSINDWTLICGLGLPFGDEKNTRKEIMEILQNLSAEFGEAQFFATHRVVEFHSWMKAVNGNIIRAYSYLGESGENLLVEGEPTEFERRYNLVNTFSKEAQKDDYFDQENLEIPDEEFVMKLAENWSINPTKLGGRKDIKNELGILGTK